MKSVSLYTLAAVGTVLSTLPRSALATHDAAALASAHHRRFHHRQHATLAERELDTPTAASDVDADQADDAEVTALAVRDSDESKQLLVKRGGYNGRATFFDPGLGACGTYSGASDYVSAASPSCFFFLRLLPRAVSSFNIARTRLAPVVRFSLAPGLTELTFARNIVADGRDEPSTVR